MGKSSLELNLESFAFLGVLNEKKCKYFHIKK